MIEFEGGQSHDEVGDFRESHHRKQLYQRAGSKGADCPAYSLDAG